ncbi:MAG: polysaccharide pyruvyl transferase CsaB [Bacillota bacterium]|nr:polysaccharide pyruvyl transferase CsaB [Bacillota bacterium]
MKVLHLIGGGDVGGARVHVLSLVKELNKYIDVKIISFRQGMFSDEAQRMGIDIEVIKNGNIFSDIKRIVKIIKEGNYQIIHSHGAKANVMALIARFFTGLPTVTTVHSDYRLDYMENTVKRYTFGLINTVALRRIDYYAGVSNNFRTMLIKRDFSPSKIFTVYNGIDFGREVGEFSRGAFAKKYNLKLTDENITVGILARLYPVKGLNTFINAAKEVCTKNPMIKFIIGGDGENRESLEKRVAELGITENVYFTGWVDDPYEFMSNLDINVLTSISESFPYSILEGALLKKATISSNVGGISDLIESGVNGYLFDAGDHKKLSEYILELSDQPELRNWYGEKIYEKAKVFFSLDSMCKSQIEIYERIAFNEKSDKGKRYKSKKYTYDAILSGYYGSGNLGDDAILTAVIKNLNMYKKYARILVIGRDPMDIKLTYGVDSIERLNVIKMLRAFKNSRLFINGGGSLIQDVKSTRSLVYYLGTIRLAKMMGNKVMLYANGIGPVNRKFNRRLTKWILNKVNFITLRENTSLNELNSMKIQRPETIVTADPAMALEPTTDTDALEIFKFEGIPETGPYACFSVRKWGMNEAYKEVIAKIADYITVEYGLKCIFIPMQCPGDVMAADDVASMMKEKGYVFKNRYSVSQTLAITKKMDILIGMRLHALIFAVISGVPMVGLEYENKIEGFLRYINQYEQAMAGHVSELNFEKLKEMVDNVWSKRDIIRNELDEVTLALKEKALENAKIAAKLIEEEV